MCAQSCVVNLYKILDIDGKKLYMRARTPATHTHTITQTTRDTPAGLEARPQGGPLPYPAGSERGHARVRLKAVSTLGVAPLKTQSFRSEEVNRKTCPCPKISGSLLNPVKSTITYQSTSLRAINCERQIR